ncbi:MAG: O-antigen ligase family protein, partial [Henriciella sp.]|nr:O-antigen ligase family protein [Henriciella sp.]
LLSMPLNALPGSLKWPMRFLGALLILVLFQLVLMPLGLWRLFGDRTLIEEGWSLFQLKPGFDQISYAPGRSLTALLYVLIPTAFLLVVHRLGWRNVVSSLPWTIAGIGAASALLGILQVVRPGMPELYLYVYTNRGAPVGFFANVNNHAIFLLMTMMFTSVLLAGFLSKRKRKSDRETGLLLVAAVLGAMQLLGGLAAGSVAGYLLLVPTLVFCFLIAQDGRQSIDLQTILVAGLVLIPIALVVGYSPLLSGLGQTTVINDGPMSRLGLAEVGLAVFWDHFLLGTGLGTFETVFKAYEDPDTVTLLYANHVHNDYLQWAIETGVIGLGLLVACLAWVLRQVLRVWRSAGDSTTRIRRAAAAAVLVPIMHSFIEYPLRTPATMALASLCIALIIVPYVSSRRSKSREEETPKGLLI